MVTLLQNLTKWSYYMDFFLRIVIVNRNNDKNFNKNDARQGKIMDQLAFKFRVFDVSLLQDNTCYVYKVQSKIILPGSWVLYFSGNLCARKINKRQKKGANIAGVQYFFWIRSCLRAHQLELCQLRLSVYLLIILLPHSLLQLTFSPPPLPGCAAPTAWVGIQFCTTASLPEL